jgi:hypothetical protein
LAIWRSPDEGVTWEQFRYYQMEGRNVDTSWTEDQSKVRYCITTTASAAGTFVLLSGDTIELSPYTSLLFHSASFGTWGDVQEVVDYTAFCKKQLEKLARDYYTPLFSEDELHNILVNRYQHWMDAEEFTERYEKALKEMEAEVKAEIAAMSDKGCSSPEQEPESLYTYEELIKMPTKKAMLEALGITPE